MADDKDYKIAISNEREARHKKLVVPSSDTGTYDMHNPTAQPDSTKTQITIEKFEDMYYKFGLANKAVNIRATRIIGEGFDLQIPDVEDVEKHLLERAKDISENFLEEINYVTFFKQSCINALVSGNEWTELIYNLAQDVDLSEDYDDDLSRQLLTLNHGDYKTIDFRRDLITNKILLDDKGYPVGYWQHIENLQDLYSTISTKFGSQETIENMEYAKDRLQQTGSAIIYGENQRELAIINSNKPNYMFLNKDEIVHLSFNQLNDNYYGISMLLPAYDTMQHLKDIEFSIAEAINSIGFPKPIIYVGDEKHNPDQKLTRLMADIVKDPVRKESFVLPYFSKMEYLNAGSLPATPDGYTNYYINITCVALQTPKELLLGDGSSNRASSFQNATDYEKLILNDRKILEEYIRQILTYKLRCAGFTTNSNDENISKYVPKIVWPKMITQDDKLKEEMIIMKYERGLITHAEARDKLGEVEIEDGERSNKFIDEIQTSNQMQPLDTDSYTSYTPDSAQHRLKKKKELNPNLNKYYNTVDVDYKKLAQKEIAEDIKTIPRYKLTKVRQAIVNGISERKSPKQIKKQIQDIAPDLTEGEVDRILVTEQRRLTNYADLRSAKNEGKKYKKWFAVLDSKTSNISKSLHGQVRQIDENFTTEYIDEQGNRKTWSGEAPPELPNSRDRIKYYKSKPKESKPKVKNYNWKGDN